MIFFFFFKYPKVISFFTFSSNRCDTDHQQRAALVPPARFQVTDNTNITLYFVSSVV